PLPSNHDDDDGGNAGCSADCTWQGRWRRGAPAARHGGRWRPDLLAVGHALPDAGGLYVHGAGAELVPVSSPCARGGIGGGRPLERSHQVLPNRKSRVKNGSDWDFPRVDEIDLRPGWSR